MVDTVTWPTISGTNHTMNLLRFGLPFVSNPGVYIFCKPNATQAGRWDPIYVGECEDFDDRLNKNLVNHHRWECIKRQGATNVCAMTVQGGKTSRTAVETDLRQRLDPPCNRQ